MCPIALRNCSSSTSSFLLHFLYKRSSRASICQPNFCFRRSAAGASDDGLANPTRISRNLTPTLGEDRFFDDILKHHLNSCFQRFSEMPFSHCSMLPPMVRSIGLRSELDLRKTQFFERTVVKRYRLSETIFRSLDVFPHFRPKYREPGRVSKVFRRNPTPNGHARSGFVSSSLICSTLFRQQATATFNVFFKHSRYLICFYCRFWL